MVALVDQLEFVARPDLALEIDIEAEGANHVDHDRNRDLGFLAGNEEAAVDRPPAAGHLAGQGPLEGRGMEGLRRLAGAADHPYVALRTGPEAQGDQPARRPAAFSLRRFAGAEREVDLLARLELARAVDPLHRGDRPLRIPPVRARADQERHQGIAPANLDCPRAGGRRGLRLERGQSGQADARRNVLWSALQIDQRRRLGSGGGPPRQAEQCEHRHGQNRGCQEAPGGFLGDLFGRATWRQGTATPHRATVRVAYRHWRAARSK